ncbi:aldose 1-epimerase [Neolewinella xylanilytica]|uniref:Aldose 1-epimerase n=1 Tax=Neolewinella xylanilytica TaxID=1514080 RepID=A0A2S6I257_9BACT|nr:aldose epimerase family protein [Neolewinella xylanilytica]PPK85230.1 aldose 1-epimerase [Neolewinella xylanilytica]
MTIPPTIASTPWGQAPEGPVTRFTLTNASGNTVAILSYGAIVQSVKIDGKEMTLGFDSLEGYLGVNPGYGATIGRYANRIGGAAFTLNGTRYEVDANEGKNQLHGGTEGFNSRVWDAEPFSRDTEAGVTLRLVSQDGDMGYPGELRVRVTYTWSDDNALRIDYAATTDQDTVVNLTNHTYFKLGEAETVLDYILQVDADRFIPVNDEQIPTGEILPVTETPFDFRSPKRVGEDIDADHPQVQAAGGFDHSLAISHYDGSLREVALVMDPHSGNQLRCWTTEPAVQVFTTNFPTGKYKMRGDAPTPRYGGICLETQHFPDSPNHDAFPTTVLKVGETFNSTTIFRFE